MSGVFDFVDQGQSRRAARKGCSFTRDFFWKDTSVDPAIVVDLTAYTPKFQVSSTKGAPALIEATTVNGKLQKQNAEGKITVNLTSIDTDSVNFGKYYYSLVLDGGPNNTVRLLEGVFEVV